MQMVHILLWVIRTTLDKCVTAASRRFVVRAPRSRIKTEHRLTHRGLSRESKSRMLNHATKIAAITLCIFSAGAPAHAQNYPSKTIRMIVAAAPGGANDILGRMYAQRLTEALGQTVVVDNRGGGGGVVGAETVAHSSPDGYTLLYCTNSVVVNPSLNHKVNYTLKDFAPVSQVASFPLVFS